MLSALLSAGSGRAEGEQSSLRGAFQDFRSALSCLQSGLLSPGRLALVFALCAVLQPESWRRRRPSLLGWHLPELLGSGLLGIALFHPAALALSSRFFPSALEAPNDERQELKAAQENLQLPALPATLSRGSPVYYIRASYWFPADLFSLLRSRGFAANDLGLAAECWSGFCN